MNISGDLTLNANTNVFTLGQGNGNGTMIDSIQNLIVTGGPVDIQLRHLLNAPMLAGQTNTLFHITGPGTCPGTNAFRVATSPDFTFELMTNVSDGKSIDVRIVTAVRALVWDGTTTSGTWSHAANSWLQNGAPPLTNFNDGDFVSFQNSGATTINITETLVPNTNGLVNFMNGEYPFLMTGVGSITGATGLRINPVGLPGALTVANNNNFSGPVILDNGSLKIGNGASSGSLGSGSISMTNPASGYQPTPLVFHRIDSNLVISGSIRGNIVITNIGEGTVTLTGNNTFTGGVYIAKGTIRLNTQNALVNNTNTYIAISNNAALDIATNQLDISLTPIEVVGSGIGGSGAILNSGTNGAFTQSNIRKVTMLGDTVIGGSGRLNHRATAASDNTNAFLSTGGNNYKLTKVGTNQWQFSGVQIDAALGDIEVQGGIFGIEWNMPTLGVTTSNLTIFTNATFQMFNLSNTVTKNLILNDGAGVSGASGTNNIFAGPVSMTGSNWFGASAGSSSLIFTDTLNGPASFYKTGPGEVVLAGTQSWTGDTLSIADGRLTVVGVALPSPTLVDIQGGILDLRDAFVTTLNRGSGQVLRGNGTVLGFLNATSDALVSPGIFGTTNSSIGRLTVSNAVTFAAATTNFMEVQAAGGGSNDSLVSSNSIALNGVLTVVTNGVGSLFPGATFKLFSAPVITGNFTETNLPTILPLTWVWTPSSGTLSIAGSLNPTNRAQILSFSRVGTNIIIRGTNLNTPNSAYHYQVLTSTNIAQSLNVWTPLATNSFNADGTFEFTNAASGTRRFYSTKAVQ
jgi:autotransporter-associated beta strand protein